MKFQVCEVKHFFEVEKILFELENSQIEIERSEVEVEVPNNETRDEEVIVTPASRSREVKPTIALDYQLIDDSEMMMILQPQRYEYQELICYVLNVA